MLFMKLLLWIFLVAYLLARLDWAVVHYTRTVNPALLAWMHAHERQYALMTGWGGYFLGGPAMALKPVFYDALISVEASQREKDAIIHAPRLNGRGFYHLPVRGEGWTFTSWREWVVYWLVPSLAWWLGARRFFQ